MKVIKKIFRLFTPIEKKKLFYLFILILITAIIDVLGVTSIFPFIAVVVNPEVIISNKFLNDLYQAFIKLGGGNIKNFIFILGVVFFMLLVLSLIFRALTMYFTTRITLLSEFTIGKKLMEHYLFQPYVSFLNQNTSDISKKILSEVQIIINNTIIPMINLAAQFLVVLAILIMLFFINPILTLSMGTILIISYLIIFYFIKNFISVAGFNSLQLNKDRFKNLNEAFAARKYIKLRKLEEFYINRFSSSSKFFVNNQSLVIAISQLPRYFIECIAFGGLIFLILIMIEQNKNFINVFPILALYAYSGYRLIPALQQIFQCFTLLRFSKLTFNSIYKDINDKKNIKNFKQAKSKNSVFLFKKSILLKNISYSYPNTDKEALKSINLKIPAFSKVGIIGKSGSGKTTLVDLILGLLNPSKGTLSVDGKYITNSNKDSWQKGIGYVPQQIYIGDSSVKENIAFGLDYQKIDNNAVIKAAKISNIHNFIVDNLQEGYDTYLGDNGAKLSGGQRQRIALARALYRKPQILILDEATNSLDNFTEQEIIDSISNLNYKITIIFITHRLEILKNFDIIFYLNNGELKINKININ